MIAESGVSDMLGVLAYPTFWVWDGARKELLGVRFRRSPLQCMNVTLGGSNVYVFEDGYFAVDSSDRLSVSVYSRERHLNPSPNGR